MKRIAMWLLPVLLALRNRANSCRKQVSRPTPRVAGGKVDFGVKGVRAPIGVQDWTDPPKYV